MTYAELTSLQYGRAKSFSDAQTDAMAAYCQAEHDLKQLQAENEKLRELVRELYHELDAATQYDAGGSRGIVSEFAGRMRKLGVDA